MAGGRGEGERGAGEMVGVVEVYKGMMLGGWEGRRERGREGGEGG